MEDNKVIRPSHVHFLLGLFKKGVDIGDHNKMLIAEAGLADIEFKEKVVQETISKKAFVKGKTTDEALQKVDILEVASIPEAKVEVITDFELDERRKKNGHIFIGRKDPIRVDEWKPESTIAHETDFVDWIDSINKNGFSNKIIYSKFTLYCQQAYTWLAENKTVSDFESEDQREDYMQEEMWRCDVNALYFLNKYVYYKDGNADGGMAKYIAAPSHEFLCYMDDCGYSVIFAKGRQMAATTTLMSLDVRDVIFKTNHFMKFITEDKEKAVEIIEDKLKFAFSTLPWWMTPDVLNERDDMFKMGYKQEKGRKEGAGSKIQVTAAKRTAIAGGSPQKVKIDEAGNIGIVGVMIGNSEPTRLFFNPATRKLEIKRQLWAWGTGGEMDKGGRAFEVELSAHMKLWDDRKFSTGIIPVFLDWTCRPGATQQNYDEARELAYAKGAGNDPDAKKHIIEFHQTWPRTLSDVFKSNNKLLVDEEYIDARVEEIKKHQQKSDFSLVEYGYFEPIFDYNEKTQDGSDVDFKIIGATFVPTTYNDVRASTAIFTRPVNDWTNRYWQGTDPIDTDTGLSNMASVVRDKHSKHPCAVLNWRIQDYRQVFLQTVLLGLYYDTRLEKKGIPELVESNRGTSYSEYKKNKGFGHSLVLNFQLPPKYQNKSTINEGVGLDNKGARNTQIVNDMHDCIELYGDRNYFIKYWEQLKTFTCSITENGREVWGTVNKKYYRDDILFADTFAYICSELCFPEKKPFNEKEQQKVKKIKYKTVRQSNGKLMKVQVR